MAPLALLFLVLRRVRIDWEPYIAIAIGVALVLSYWLSNGGYGNENFIASFMLVGGAFLIGKRWEVLILGAITIYLLAFNNSNFELVALALLVCLGLWNIGKTGKIEAVVCLALFVALSLPVLHSTSLTTSLLSRAELAINGLVMWWEHPIIGWGLGGFNHSYPAFADADIHLIPWKGWSVLGDAHVYPGAAHNEVVQVLNEFGLIGLGLMVAFLWRTRLTPPLLMLGALALISFPLQNPATALLGVVALAQGAPAEGRDGPNPLLLPVAAFCAFWGVQAVIAQWYFFDTAVYTQTNPIAAFRGNVKAFNAFPHDPQIRRQYFRSLSHVVQKHKRAVIDREYGEAVYSISRSASPDYPGLLLARYSYLRRFEICGEECAQIHNTLVRQASRMWEVRKLTRWETERQQGAEL